MPSVKQANIWDPVEATLDQRVFDDITPRKSITRFIERLYYNAAKKLVPDPQVYIDLYITGSLTTFQYSDSSDCDVSVFPAYDEIGMVTGLDPKELRRQLVALSIEHIDGTFLPGGLHPLQFFVVADGIAPTDLYKPGLRSAYSLKDKEWVVPPEKERSHDIEVELPEAFHKAHQMADKMNQALDHDPETAREMWHQLHRKRQLEQREGLGDWAEGNIIYKWLLHEGIFDRLRNELNEYIASATAPLIMYHVSPADNRGSIQNKGLDPEHDWTGYGAIFLSEKPLPTEPGTDVWRVFTKGLALRPDESTPMADWWMTNDVIPTHRLELLEHSDLQYVAAEEEEEKKILVIYDFAGDKIILGIEAARKREDERVVGHYDGKRVVLHHNEKQWISPAYFKKLWQQSYPTRTLSEVVFDRGD